MKEDQIIEFLRKRFPHFIGDDAAFLKSFKNKNSILTKDLLIEDVHFRKRYFKASELAHKALHINLSDLAAMGAKPEFVLLGLSIPKNSDLYIKDFLKSFCTLCKKNKIQLIGGDTTKSESAFFISVTAFGSLKRGHSPKFRHLSKNSDILYVAGSLGYAHIGLELLERNQKGFSFFKRAFKKPKAKVLEGLWLSQRKEVTAMMDLSDGLYVDLLKMCKASHLSAKINLNFLKRKNAQFKEASKALNLNPLEVMLMGGEDYGLLFSVQKKYSKEIEEKFFSHFKYKIKKIGEMQNGKGLEWIQDGIKKNLNFKLKHFFHFDE